MTKRSRSASPKSSQSEECPAPIRTQNSQCRNSAAANHAMVVTDNRSPETALVPHASKSVPA